jgi:hypothetical protein
MYYLTLIATNQRIVKSERREHVEKLLQSLAAKTDWKIEYESI